MKLVLYNIYKRISSRNKKKNILYINLTFRYIDDVLSLNNPKFNYYIGVIYPEELDIKDTAYALKWANYLDRVEFDEDGKLYTRLYDKPDD